MDTYGNIGSRYTIPANTPVRKKSVSHRVRKQTPNALMGEVVLCNNFLPRTAPGTAVPTVGSPRMVPDDFYKSYPGPSWVTPTRDRPG